MRHNGRCLMGDAYYPTTLTSLSYKALSWGKQTGHGVLVIFPFKVENIDYKKASTRTLKFKCVAPRHYAAIG